MLKVLVVLFAFFTAQVALCADVGDIPLDQFLGSFLKLLVGFFSKQPDGSDLGWAVKVSALVMLLVSIPKVSALRPFWDKLAGGKIWAGPALAVIGGIAEMLLNGKPVTLNGLMLFFGAGVGSIALHELLDWVKGLPGLNKYVAMLLDLIELVLRRPDGGQNLVKSQASPLPSSSNS